MEVVSLHNHSFHSIHSFHSFHPCPITPPVVATNILLARKFLMYGRMPAANLKCDSSNFNLIGALWMLLEICWKVQNSVEILRPQTIEWSTCDHKWWHKARPCMVNNFWGGTKGRNKQQEQIQKRESIRCTSLWTSKMIKSPIQNSQQNHDKATCSTPKASSFSELL